MSGDVQQPIAAFEIHDRDPAEIDWRPIDWRLQPVFVEFAGERGSILVGLHNVVKVQPCRRYPEIRTAIWSRSDKGTLTVVTLPYAQVVASIVAALAAAGGQ
jgi:hypothetical protein